MSARFCTTHWSVVLAAGGGCSKEAREALETLCRRYWLPLYGFIRRQGNSAEDAGDLTQGFLADLIERNSVGKADPLRGRFRSYLLGALKHYLANQRDRSQALKRGGGRTCLSLDLNSAESRYTVEQPLGPEQLFERQWAMALLEGVLNELRQSYQQNGKGPLFEALKGHLTGAPARYADVARELGLSEGAIKVAAHRMRSAYRQLLLEHIASTVEDENDVQEELACLFRAVGGK